MTPPSASSIPPASAELIVVPPASSTTGGVEAFIKRCVVHGIDLYFEAGDRLPARLPTGIQGVKAITIDASQVEANREALSAYERTGTQVYRMADTDPGVPNTVLSWSSMLTFHVITIDGGLTARHPAMHRRMGARDEDRLFNDLGESVLARQSDRWYDATRYQWEGMLDGYEVTGDERYRDTARRQMRHMVDHVPNDLSNCDTVAPLEPMLRLHQATGEPWLLDTARDMFDRYIEHVPRWRGVFMNFDVYTNHARAEIIWQVLPGIMRLAQVTGEARYADIAIEQYDKLYAMLYNREENLWHHGLGVTGPTQGFWARGVAFTLLANLMMLEATDDDSHRADMHKSLKATVKRLSGLQDEQGFWSCVVDQPWTQPESSGTAWIGAAVQRGIRLGLLEPTYQTVADKAWDAVKSRVWRGDFPGHMTATTTTTIPGYYHKMHLSDTGWAHFAFRLACERRFATKSL